MSTALLVMWLWAAQFNVKVAGGDDLACIETTIKALCTNHSCDAAETGVILDGCAKKARAAKKVTLADPVDVPAVRHSRGKICLSGHNAGCQGKLCKWECDVVEPDKWTCADKSRILLTAEDGKRHCIKFGGR